MSHFPKAVNGVPQTFSWAGERHRHELPSLISHWLCCNPGPSALPFLTIQFPLLQPQAVDIIIPRFTQPKRRGEVLIPNPCESIHFSPALALWSRPPRHTSRQRWHPLSQHRSKWGDTVRLLASEWAENSTRSLGCSKFGSTGRENDRHFVMLMVI